jgi:enterochelin esterase family protein
MLRRLFLWVSILDNLIAAGKAKPMLVVMPNGNVPSTGGGRGGYSAAGMAGYGNELLNNIIPFIESDYRATPNAQNRAVAGLSMGGGQDFFTGLGNKDKFATIGVFSTGVFGGISNPAGGAAGFNAEEQIPGIYSNAKAFNDSLEVLYISVGEQDPRLEPTKKTVPDFKSHGLNVEFASFPGSHEWQVWRKSLHDFAQRIFK